MWRPGKLRFLIGVKNLLPIGRPRRPENAALCRAALVARFRDFPQGYALRSSRLRRHRLILIDARFSSCLPRSTSPLLANVYLHYVYDLWVQQWRKRHATGDMIVVR